MKDKKYFFFFINLFFIGLGIFGGVKIYQMNQDNSKYQINEVGAEPGQVITIGPFELILEEIKTSYDAYDEEFSINKSTFFISNFSSILSLFVYVICSNFK